MINTEDTNIASRVCDELDNAGVGIIFIKSKDSSDIAQLDAVTPTEAFVEGLSENAVFGNMDLVNATTRKNLSGVYEHDVVLERLVDKVFAVIDQRTAITRDRAIPMVSAIIAGLNKIYNLSFTEANVYSIVELGLPSGISSEVVSRLIGTYCDSQYPRIQIDTVNKDSLVKLSVENGSVGASEQLVELFNKLYVEKSDGIIPEAILLDDAVSNLFWLTHDTPATYDNAQYLARRLMVADLLLNAETLPTAISGYSTAINNFLQGEASFAAKQLKIIESYRDNQLSRKELIASVDNYALVIKVNGEVYKAWLGMGGTAEALIGYVADRGPLEGHYDTILDNITKYSELYNIYKLKICDVIEANQLTIYKKNLPYQLQSALIEDGFTQDQVNAIVTASGKSIADLPTATGERFHMAILRIIDEQVFPGLDVFKIASEMNRISTAIPGISPAQANELVMSDMLLDYIASQLITTRVG